MPYGRPMKGKYRRVPTTVHIPTGTLDIIDDYIEEHGGGKMSRSDFINEAIDARLKELGLAEDDSPGEVTPG